MRFRSACRLGAFSLLVLVVSSAGCGESPSEAEVPVGLVTATIPKENLVVGSLMQVTAAASDTAGNPLPGQTFRYTVGDSAVATVSEAGLITGRGVGTTMIVAEAGGESAEVGFTVVPAPKPTTPASTLLSYTSDPDDPVGQGETVRLTKDQARWFSKFITPRTELEIRVQAVAGGGSLSGGGWMLRLEAPTNQELSVGQYANVARYPFNGANAGLAFTTRRGGGCNTIKGQFEIHDIAFGHRNTLYRLHASFEQHCDGAAPTLRGEIAIVTDS